jgi:hypothetical protein
MKTLNQHISILRTFANNHYQVNDFGVGDIWEWNSSGVVYPLMWVELDGSSITDGTLTDNYRVHFVDMVRSDEVNETNAVSSMKSVAIDLLAYLANSTALSAVNDIVNSAAIEYVTEVNDDSVAGVVLNMSIDQAMNYNYCSIPFSGAPSSGSVCPNVTIYDGGGNVVTTIPAGGSYTVSGTGGTINVYLDGVLQSSTSSSNLNAETVNILWT